jgi:hypothetical protein
MSAKDLIIDFINLVFLIALIAFVVFYFIVGDRFGSFVRIMESLVPISFFCIIMLIALRLKRDEIKRLKKIGDGNTEITLRLSLFDKYKGDALIFLLPIVILSIPLFIEKIVTFADIIQATAAFLFMYFWNKYLFDKGQY